MSISGILEKSFSHEPTNDSKFVRDYFNLHKIILVITKQLKVSAEFLTVLFTLFDVVMDFVFFRFLPLTMSAKPFCGVIWSTKNLNHFQSPVQVVMFVFHFLSNEPIVIIRILCSVQYLFEIR